MKVYVKVMDKLNASIFNLLAVVFGVITLLTIYQVFARYVLKNPLVWSEAIIRYLMIWIVVLGTAIALRKGLLISVEALLHIVPKKVKKVLQVIIIIISMVFLSLLIKNGFDIMNSLANQKTGSINIPVSWVYAAIPFGSILALLNCFTVLIELFIEKEKEEQPDGSTIIH